jgi:hypothetical protein
MAAAYFACRKGLSSVAYDRWTSANLSLYDVISAPQTESPLGNLFNERSQDVTQATESNRNPVTHAAKPVPFGGLGAQAELILRDRNSTRVVRITQSSSQITNTIRPFGAGHFACARVSNPVRAVQLIDRRRKQQAAFAVQALTIRCESRNHWARPPSAGLSTFKAYFDSRTAWPNGCSKLR